MSALHGNVPTFGDARGEGSRSIRRPAGGIVCGLVAILFFFASWILLGFYTGGDNRFYAAFYNVLPSLDLSDVRFSQRAMVGGSEPLYGALMWLGARLDIDRIVYLSLFNGVLVASLLVVVRRAGAGWLFCALVFSNYYLFVLLLAAERLKFAYVAVLLALMFRGWVRWLLLLLAPFLHFQTLIAYLCAALPLLRRVALASIRSASVWRLAAVGIGVLLGAAMLIPLLPAIQGKLAAYSGRGLVVFELANLTALWVAGLLVTQRKADFSLMMLASIVAAVIVGPERVNMIGVTLFIGHLLAERRVNNWVVYLIMGYLSAKSVGFIYNVVHFGNGFMSTGAAYGSLQ